MASIDTLLEEIQGSKYVATDKQLGELAIAVSTGRRADGTYLRVLIVRAIKLLGDHTPLQAVNKAHEKCMAVIRAAVTEPDMKLAEVTRRCSFAYSSASTRRRASLLQG